MFWQAYSAIEASKATKAWTFASAAADLCQRLGYHRLQPQRGNDQGLREAQERLFWTVHKIEKGLSLRLGRASNIRDSEITIHFDSIDPLHSRLARIQGRIYDQLYSPAALYQNIDERSPVAEALAGDLRQLIDDVHVDIFVRLGRFFGAPGLANQILQDATTAQSTGLETDPMRVIYLQCDLVCQLSCLTLILRAIPAVTSTGVSDQCIQTAREALDIHQECMIAVKSCQNDPSQVTKYINW